MKGANIMDNIFDRACLIQLSTSCWQGSAKLRPTVMEKIGNSQWLKGAKVLVDPDSLSSIRSVITNGRALLQRAALPFPITGLTLVPKETITRIDATLKYIKDQFRNEVDDFLLRYDFERARAREELGDLFDASDYPVDIKSKFRFDWRFVTLSVPGKSDILSPEIYEREKEKFRSLMDETRDLVTVALREEFAGIVRHMTERLTGSEDGKPKRFKFSMMEKLKDFIVGFDDRNLFHDETLSQLVAQVGNLTEGLSIDELRDDRNLRQYIGGEMNRIKDQMDEWVEDLPRRKIRIAA